MSNMKKIYRFLLLIIILISVTGCRLMGIEGSSRTIKCKHEFGEYVIDKNPTCSTSGHKYRICSLCNYKDEDSIDPLPHTYGDVIKGTKDDAYYDVKVCKVCGYRQHIGSSDDIIFLNLKDEYETNEYYKLDKCFRVDGKIYDKNTYIDNYTFTYLENTANAKLEFLKVSSNNYDLNIKGTSEGICKFTVHYKYDTFYSSLDITSSPVTIKFVSTPNKQIICYDGKNIVYQKNDCRFGETIKLPTQKDKGELKFAGWINENGEYVKEVTIKNSKETFKAVFASSIGTEGLEYKLNSTSTGFIVTGYNGVETDVVIPGIYKTRPVVEIAEGCFKSSGIGKVTIPSTVVNIGKEAFSNSSIEEIDCSNAVSLTTIGNNAFYSTNLSSISLINTNLTTIGSYCFYNNTNLTYAHIPSSIKEIGDRCFFYDKKTHVLFESLDKKNVTEGSFWDGYNSDSVKGIYYNVKEIKENDDYVYYVTNDNYVGIMRYKTESSRKTDIVLDKVDNYPIKYVCSKAFYGSSITSVIIGKDVVLLGSSSFDSCSQLTKVDYVNNKVLTTIGSYCFYNNTNLTYAHIPSSIKEIGDRCFFYDKKTHVLFESLDKKNVTEGSFWDGYNSDSVKGIYYNVKEIKENDDYVYYVTNDNYACVLSAKSSCQTADLSTIDGFNVRGVCTYAFNGSNINKIIIGEKVEWIDSYGFANSKSLIYVESRAASKLKTIGAKAFSHCDNLKFIFIPLSVTSIGNYCFEYDVKCWVIFARLNSNGITLGTKWNGYNDDYFIFQVNNSIYSTKWDCQSAYYNPSNNQIYCTSGTNSESFSAQK